MRLHPFTSTFLVYVLPFSKFAWNSISTSISENSKPRSIFLLFICRGWIEREKKLFRKICSRLQNNQKTTHSWLISGEPAEKSMVSGSNLTILAMILGGCRQQRASGLGRGTPLRSAVVAAERRWRAGGRWLFDVRRLPPLRHRCRPHGGAAPRGWDDGELSA